MWKKKQIVRKIVRRKKKRQDPSKLGEPPNLKKSASLPLGIFTKCLILPHFVVIVDNCQQYSDYTTV